LNGTEIINKALKERQPTNLCQVKGSICELKRKDGKCKALLVNGKRCTGLIGIVIDNVAGTIKDTWTQAEIPLELWEMMQVQKEERPMKELKERARITVLGTNEEVLEGITVKAGKKYYIISRSPFDYEVIIFACDSKGHCSSTHGLWTGCSIQDAKDFLANNQP
jgi:hypothetical protein